MAGPTKAKELREEARENPEIVNKDRRRAIQARLRSMPESSRKEREKSTFRAVTGDMDEIVDQTIDANKAEGVPAHVIKKEINQSLLESLKEGVASAAQSEYGQKAIGGAKTAADVVDFLGKHLVRRPAAAALDLPDWAYETASDFDAQLAKRARQGHTDARVVQAIGPAVGGALLGRANATRAAIGALIGGGLPKVLDAVGLPGGDFIRSVAMHGGVDPLNALGMSTVKEGLEGATGRLLRGAAVTGKARQAAEQAIASAMKSGFGPGEYAQVSAALRKAGVPDQEILNAFGVRGERLARGQFTIGGKQVLAEVGDRVARAAGAGGGKAEFLGDKLVDVATKKLQETRAKHGLPLPFVSRNAPEVGETLGQESHRIRLFEQAEREARHGGNTVREFFESQVEDGIKNKQGPKTNAQLDADLAHAAEQGRTQTRQLLDAKLAQAAGGKHTLKSQEYLDEFTKGIESADTAQEAFDLYKKWWNKKNLVRKPLYTSRNIAEDASKLFVEGVSPGRFIDADRAIKLAATGREKLAKGAALSKEEADAVKLLDDARAAGVDVGSSVRQDLGVTAGANDARQKRRALGKMAGLPEAPRKGLEKIDDALEAFGNATFERLPAGMMMNRKGLDWWEPRARLAVYQDGLAQGLSPALASERTAKILLDYGRKFGRHDTKIRNVFAFPHYTAQAPAAAATLVARNPGKVNQLMAVAEAAQEKPSLEDTAAPRWQQERGFTVNAPKPLRQLRQNILGTEGPVEQSSITVPIAPVNEATLPIELAQALASGSFSEGMNKFFGHRLSPFWQHGQAVLSQADPLTGEEIDSPGRDFLARVLGPVSPSFVVDAVIEAGVNAVDPDAPDRFMNKYDESDSDAHTEFAKNLLDVFGKTTDPGYTQELSNWSSSPDAKIMKDLAGLSNKNLRSKKQEKKDSWRNQR